ncbi:MAG: hypothetical protein WKF86_05575 [Acidimicrobiales bacterium]
MIRRILLTAGAMIFILASPAAAGYSDVLGAGQQRKPTAVAATQGPTGETGGLARTGSADIVPMAEAATVLVGSGALLIVVARRRRSRDGVAATS